MSALLPLGDKTLTNALVCLEPIKDQHIEPLRVACAEDQDIWDIYPHSMVGEYFDPAIEKLRSSASKLCFAVTNITTHQVIGMSSYLNPDSEGVVEIGSTYIAPALRGTGFNYAMKTLMLDHAFSCGYRKVEFKVDTRNQRSMAAVLKLGAQQEGVLRQNRVTWTGYIRDTAIFGLLKQEWAHNRSKE